MLSDSALIYELSFQPPVKSLHKSPGTRGSKLSTQLFFDLNQNLCCGEMEQQNCGARQNVTNESRFILSKTRIYDMLDEFELPVDECLEVCQNELKCQNKKNSLKILFSPGCELLTEKSLDNIYNKFLVLANQLQNDKDSNDAIEVNTTNDHVISHTNSCEISPNAKTMEAAKNNVGCVFVLIFATVCSAAFVLLLVFF